MEYRAHVTVDDFPESPENEAGVELLRWLDEHTDMGPAMSGPDQRSPAVVVLATDAPNEAAAVRAMTDALAVALDGVGLEHCYPGHIEIEPT